MNKRQLTFLWVAALLFAISGCITYSVRSPHITETTLTWFAYGSGKSFEDNAVKEEYRKKIEEYLKLHPQTSKVIADKMKNCRVILGMTEEEVLTMAKPNRIIKTGKNRKVFRYSDVGKFGWSRFIGEGIKTQVRLTNGVVTDISEIDTTLGN